MRRFDPIGGLVSHGIGSNAYSPRASSSNGVSGQNVMLTKPLTYDSNCETS